MLSGRCRGLGARARRVRVEVTALQRGPGFQPALGSRVFDVARRQGATVLHAHHYSPYIYSCLAKLRRPSLRVVFTEHGRLSDDPPSAKRRVANQSFAASREMCSRSRRTSRRTSSARALVLGRSASSTTASTSGHVQLADLAAVTGRRLAVGDAEFVIRTVARLDPVGAILLERCYARRRRWREASARPSSWSATAPIGTHWKRWPWNWASRRASAFLVSGTTRATGWRDAMPTSTCSISEGVSLTILEARRPGLPVVATRVGGTPEVMQETCGLRVPNGDAESLALTLRALAEDARSRESLGSAARGRVEENFTLGRMIDAYRSVYGGRETVFQ